MLGHPFRASRGEEATFRGDPVIGDSPGSAAAFRGWAAEPVFAPRDRDVRPKRGQIDVSHDRPVFDAGAAPARAAGQVHVGELDQELDSWTDPAVVQDAYVF